MALNREQKRMLRKQGELGPDGEPVRTKRAPAGTQDRRNSARPPRQFVKEVRGELRKVVWPTKSETINYSIIVLVTLGVLHDADLLHRLGLLRVRAATVRSPMTAFSPDS